MGLDPVEALLPAPGWAGGGPADGNFAKGRPKRVVAFGIDQN
jgi:hypothetical protein